MTLFSLLENQASCMPFFVKFLDRLESLPPMFVREYKAYIPDAAARLDLATIKARALKGGYADAAGMLRDVRAYCNNTIGFYTKHADYDAASRFIDCAKSLLAVIDTSMPPWNPYR